MEECSICLELLKTDVGVLKCKHIFHYSCLLEWKRHLCGEPVLCPLCREPGKLTCVVDIYISKNGRVRYKFSKTSGCVGTKKSWICSII